jgi:predicted transporter
MSLQPHTLTITLLACLFFTSFLIGYDVYLVQKWGVEATISWRTLQFTIQNPAAVALLALAIGILRIHLFNDRQGHFDLSNPVVIFLIAESVGSLLALLTWVQRGP